MSFSEIPPPPEVTPGNDEPSMRVEPPGPQSRSWMTRASVTSVPMGRPPPSRPAGSKVRSLWSPGTIVYSTAKGSNVIDVDGNRYVDLAAGFGAMLLGHAHGSIVRAVSLQAPRLMQALGDVHPSEAKIALSGRLAEICPIAGPRVVLGQSGADAVTAALKSALLATGRPGVVAFNGSYHGLSYAPLAACGFRESYRRPFSAQLNRNVKFVDWPSNEDDAQMAVERVRLALSDGDVGAVLLEPIQGRAGVVLPPPGFLAELGRVAHAAGALVLADEIWTGLGRSGRMLFSTGEGLEPDLICLGKGLGGGLPISACIASDTVMQSWRGDEEVVDTSTFAGAPLACVSAIATLDAIHRDKLVQRSAELGARWLSELGAALSGSAARASGAGLMVGIDLDSRSGRAVEVARECLKRGYLVSTGGAGRDAVVLTPPLTISEELLARFVPVLKDALNAAGV